MRPLAPRPALVALLPLLLLLLPERAGGIPKVQKELNVHGPKDDDLRPDAISPEAVAKLYMALLGRPVDDHGAAHYQSGAGYSVTQVADELLNSMEFRAKYSDNEMDSFGIPVEFAQAARFQDVLSVDIMATELDVRYLYSRLFDRQPDEVALAAYAPVIEAKSLAVIDMISDLMRSDEFGVSFLYQRILGAYTRGSARQVPWFPSFLPSCLPACRRPHSGQIDHALACTVRAPALQGGRQTRRASGTLPSLRRFRSRPPRRRPMPTETRRRWCLRRRHRRRKGCRSLRWPTSCYVRRSSFRERQRTRRPLASTPRAGNR
jgi:hypothetical protein